MSHVHYVILVRVRNYPQLSAVGRIKMNPRKKKTYGTLHPVTFHFFSPLSCKSVLDETDFNQNYPIHS